MDNLVSAEGIHDTQRYSATLEMLSTKRFHQPSWVSRAPKPTHAVFSIPPTTERIQVSGTRTRKQEAAMQLQVEQPLMISAAARVRQLFPKSLLEEIGFRPGTLEAAVTEASLRRLIENRRSNPDLELPPGYDSLTIDWMREEYLTSWSSALMSLERMKQTVHRVWTEAIDRGIPQIHKTLMQRRHIHRTQTAVILQKVLREHDRRERRLIRNAQARSHQLMRELYSSQPKSIARQRSQVTSERRRNNEELERRRSDRKLDFLLTQTEMFGSFLRSKDKSQFMKRAQQSAVKMESTDDNVEPPISFDDESYDEEKAMELATEGAFRALASSNRRASTFEEEPIPDQPAMLQATLKTYQIEGFKWLAGLYDVDVNGILADDMGLGKTIQSLSLLAYLTERYDTWGPFLVITPASTLHNWQRETERFVPELKILPYWGQPSDRKIFRTMLKQSQLGYKTSPFHICITNYSLAVLDAAHLSHVHWNYVILDEAQAIKSSSSVRWQTLLNLPNKNRLLLTGTPIQNNMSELWSLLHFIMPSLFDDLKNFNAWFNADMLMNKKLSADSDQIKRLQQILKPFMLRRTKHDVESQLGDKTEVTILCDLTRRQRKLYRYVFENISFDRNSADDDALRNMVMQLRKVCNHVGLFDPIEATSPFYCGPKLSADPLLWPVNPVIPSAAARRSGKRRVVQKVTTTRNLVVSDRPSFLSITISQELLMILERTVSRYGLIQLPSWLVALGDFAASCFHYRFGDCHWLLDQLELHIDRLAKASHAEAHSFSPARSFVECLRPYVFSHIGLVQTYGLSFINRAKSLFWEGNTVMAYAANAISNPPRLISRGYASARVLDYLREQQYFVRRMNRSLTELWTAVGPVQVFQPHLPEVLGGAGKLLVFDRLMRRLKQEKSRCLVYCQLTSMLDILELYLIYMKYKYVRFDGSVSVEERRDLVFQFQNDPDIFVFLLSTRAGGQGINLTAANTVVFYESDWNPTMDRQAMDRAHRLGQTQHVTVYRLITRKTIEERILNRADMKHRVQQAVMEDASMSHVSEMLEDEDADPTTEDMLNMLDDDGSS